MTNVIPFPKEAVYPNTIEDAHQRVLEARQTYVDEILEDVMDHLFNDITNYGIRLKGEGSHHKDIYFVTEAVQALLQRYVGIEHPMHQIIDDSVSLELITDEVEDGVSIPKDAGTEEVTLTSTEV